MPSITVDDLFDVKTGSYLPPQSRRPSFSEMGLRPFTSYRIEEMMRDPTVRLGMAIKTAPILKPKIELSSKRPEIANFALETFRSLWTAAVPKITSGFWYTVCGGEMVYRRHSDGMIRFEAFRQVYPEDISVLTQNGRRVGIKVRKRIGKQVRDKDNTNEITLLGPKSFLYIHKEEFGSIEGRSEFEGAYEPWLEKNDIGGAKSSRKLWHWKNAFGSGEIHHPPGEMVLPNGQKVSHREIAMEVGELAHNGHFLAFEMKYAEDGSLVEQYVFKPASINPGGQSLVDYVLALDKEMLNGMEIPDDIASAVSGTGSFAGRTVPMMAFFASQSVTMRSVFNCLKEQTVDPLCILNYGSADYNVDNVDIDTEQLMPSTPSAPNAEISSAGGVRDSGQPDEGDDGQQAAASGQ